MNGQLLQRIGGKIVERGAGGVRRQLLNLSRRDSAVWSRDRYRLSYVCHGHSSRAHHLKPVGQMPIVSEGNRARRKLTAAPEDRRLSELVDLRNRLRAHR